MEAAPGEEEVNGQNNERDPKADGPDSAQYMRISQASYGESDERDSGAD